MITKERLDEIAKRCELGSRAPLLNQEMLELIRLARLGLRYENNPECDEVYDLAVLARWARDHAKPALEKEMHRQEKDDGGTFIHIIEALAAFPKLDGEGK